MRNINRTTIIVFGLMSLTAGVARADCGGALFKLLADDGATFDNFGWSIDIDNGVAAVGAWGNGDRGPTSGSAYLFDAFTGAQLFKLIPSDGQGEDNFGYSIAIVAIGARYDDDNGFRSGSAYLFDSSTGEQIAKLLPSDGAERDWFGWSIAIDDGVVAVGAPADDDNGSSSGSAYLFDASTGAQIAKLLPSDGAEIDQFGRSVAIGNGVVAVGAWGDDDNGSDSGSAYLFDAITGAQIAKLLPSDGEAGDRFGLDVSIDNGVVAVGAFRNDDNGSSSGSAYLFEAITGVQIVKILPGDGADSDRFGYSIAIGSGIVAVGAYLDDDNGSQSGSAYLFDANDCGNGCVRSPEWQCDGDVDGDGQVNPVDGGLVQAAFGSLDAQDLCNYDFDCDGQINPVDGGIVQSLFGTCDAPRGVCP